MTRALDSVLENICDRLRKLGLMAARRIESPYCKLTESIYWNRMDFIFTASDVPGGEWEDTLDISVTVNYSLDDEVHRTSVEMDLSDPADRLALADASADQFSSSMLDNVFSWLETELQVTVAAWLDKQADQLRTGNEQGAFFPCYNLHHVRRVDLAGQPGDFIDALKLGGVADLRAAPVSASRC